MIDKSLWSPEELEIFSEFSFMCVRCLDDAETLHEIIPKSLNPNWKDKENRVPLCKVCHKWAHDLGTKHSKLVLERKREELRAWMVP